MQILKYADYSYKTDLTIIEENLNLIFDNLNESKPFGNVQDLLQKGKNIADFVSGTAGKISDVLDNPKKILDFFRSGNVMSKKQFEEFARAYSEIYNDLDADFIDDHKRNFDIINDIINTYIKKKSLDIEIGTAKDKRTEKTETDDNDSASKDWLGKSKKK